MRRRCIWAAFSSHSWAPHYFHRAPWIPRAGTGETLLPLPIPSLVREWGDLVPNFGRDEHL